MKHMAIILILSLSFLLYKPALAGMFSPHLEIDAGGGATQSFLETTRYMNYLMEPTSPVEKQLRPAFTVNCNLYLGSYFGVTTGMGYRHYGQSTAPTTVFLNDDIFEHDFKSYVNIDYFAMPFLLKAGIRRKHFSVFLRGGFVPSLLISGESVWIIDDKKVTAGSSRMPKIDFNSYDIPVQFGGEVGVYIGKNGLFLVGEYTHGFNSIAYGIPGNVLVRGYGATLQYRRVIF